MNFYNFMTYDYEGPGSSFWSLSSTSEAVAASATSGNVTVTATSTCGWDAASNAAWITISSGGGVNGSGAVDFTFSANTGTAARVGTLTVAGQTVTVTQAAPSTSANQTPLFAPYVDMSLAADEQVLAMQQQAGLKAVTLAFLVGVNNTCSIGWGGLGETLPSDNMYDGQSIQSVVQDMQKNGVQVIMSFGGATGPDPAVTCTNATELQALYQSVITRYKVTMLDFDIEGAAIANTAATTRRDQALKMLKAANPNLIISYTLPVTQSGFDANGLNVINHAKADGVALSTVNIMAMDYGPVVSNMGMAATSAASVESQLITANLTTATIGITPMIGVNDSAGETFSLANAQTVFAFANANKNVVRLGMWSLARDNGNCAGKATASPVCSGLSQSTYAFSTIFNEVQ